MYDSSNALKCNLRVGFMSPAYLFSILLMANFLSGCISVISPQTANTLEPGQVSAYAALTTPVFYVQTSKKSESDSSSDSNSGSNSGSSRGDSMEALWIDVGTRYGLANGLDLGIEKTNLITRFDLKKRLFGSAEGFAMAIGAGVGSNNLAGFLNSKKAYYFIRTADLPIYLSKRVGKSSSLYSVLRYHYTQVQSGYTFVVPVIDLSSDSSSSSSNVSDMRESGSARNVAVSIGGVFGEPVGFFLELAMIKGMDKENNDATRPQIALGVTLLNSKSQQVPEKNTTGPNLKSGRKNKL